MEARDSFCFPKNTKNPNPSPIGKKFGFCCRGAPNLERQIVRFDVLSLCRKAAAHFLHTVCTFARIGGFSAQGLHSLLSFA